MQRLNHADRLAVTRAIMGILDSWGVDGADVIRLLELPPGTRVRHLERYRTDTPFPAEGAVSERLEHVAGIADALRTTFPRNAHMGALWMSRPNRRFGNRSPLATMLAGGLNGLITVRSHLDCSYAWDKSGSKT